MKASKRFTLRHLQPTEGEVSAGVKKGLALHPSVAMRWRQNVGSGYLVGYHLYQELTRVGAFSGALAALREAGVRSQAPTWVEFGAAGMPDHGGILRGGRALQVEVKRPGKRPEQHQQEWIDIASAAGALAFWVDNLDDLWQRLNEAGR
ncbi:MAG: hypothetical protein ACREX4_20175 [Gammaproteobacteria bacterium]